MKTTLIQLRRLKGEALDCMTELNNRGRTENRDLTETELASYTLKKAWVEDLNSVIALLELESEIATLREDPPASSAPQEGNFFVDRNDRDPAAPFLFLHRS